MNVYKGTHRVVGVSDGIHYGDKVAEQTHPVVVIIPEYLKNAPTIYERLAGAKAVPAPGSKNTSDMTSKEPIKQPPGVIWVPIPGLRERRIATGLSQSAFSRIICSHRTTYSRWESRNEVPSEMYHIVIEALQRTKDDEFTEIR